MLKWMMANGLILKLSTKKMKTLTSREGQSRKIMDESTIIPVNVWYLRREVEFGSLPQDTEPPNIHFTSLINKHTIFLMKNNKYQAIVALPCWVFILAIILINIYFNCICLEKET